MRPLADTAPDRPTVRATRATRAPRTPHAPRAILVRLTPALVLFAGILATFPIGLAAAAALSPEWIRRELKTGALSMELPSSWTLEVTSDDRIVMREYPAEEVIAALTVETFPVTASLDFWKDFHKDTQILGTYPGATIRREERRKLGAFTAWTFEVTDLGSDRREYALMQTIISTGRHFVLFNLYADRSRPEHYRKLLDRVVESVERTGGGVSVHEPARQLGPPPADRIDWQRSFSAAFAEAEKRQVPVMIAFNMDGEWANDMQAEEFYRHPRIVGLSRKMVCLVASVYDHGGRDVPGGRREPCPRFGRVTCSEHRDVDIAAREKYIRSKKVIAPQHVFCAPDGRMLIRREWHVEMRELEDLMRRSLSALERSKGPEEDGATVDEIVDRFRKAPDSGARYWIVSDTLFSGRPQHAQEILERLIEKSDEERLVDLMAGLGFAGHPDGIPFAVRGLSHGSTDVRDHAAVALEQIALPEASDAILKRLDRERESRVRKNLLRALGACAGEEERLATILVRRSKSGSELERANALIALRHFPDSERVEKALLATLGDERAPARVRAAAAWTLGDLECQAARDALDAAAPALGGTWGRVLEQARQRLDGTFDWRESYEEILENLAGDTIFRREPEE